jgi:hypothetical protein
VTPCSCPLNLASTCKYCRKFGSALPWKLGIQRSKVVDYYGGMSILPHEQSTRVTPVFQVQYAIWD